MVKWEKGKWAKWATDYYCFGDPDHGDFIKKAKDGTQEWIYIEHSRAVGRRKTVAEAKAGVEACIKERAEIYKAAKGLTVMGRNLL
jgi:hypothetical protein